MKKYGFLFVMAMMFVGLLANCTRKAVVAPHKALPGTDTTNHGIKHDSSGEFVKVTVTLGVVTTGAQPASFAKVDVFSDFTQYGNFTTGKPFKTFLSGLADASGAITFNNVKPAGKYYIVAIQNNGTDSLSGEPEGGNPVDIQINGTKNVVIAITKH